MFMTFKLFSSHNPHDYDAPVGNNEGMAQQKICINIKRVDNVQQSGSYREMPVEPQPNEVPDELRGIIANANENPLLAPARRANRPARVRRREIFVVDKDRFTLIMENGHNYTVMGDFDEFCETLCSFRNKLETV